MNVYLPGRIRMFSVLLLTYVTLGCTERWPTKEESKLLEGRWALVSISAQDVITKKDTTWLYTEGFLDFTYTGKSGAAPLVHSFSKGEAIRGEYSVFENGKILVMYHDPAEFENSTVALSPSSHASFELEGNQLFMEGFCSINRKTNLSFRAIFERK